MFPANTFDGVFIAAAILILAGILYIGFMLWAAQKDREWEEKKQQRMKRVK